MADNKNPLPDISGVFNIDESRIPSKIIAKPEEKKQPQQSILLRPETRAEEKQQEKLKKQVVKTKRKQAKRKELRQKLILGGAAVLVLLALVLLIRGAILNAKRPVVAVSAAARADVTAHYDTEGTIIGEPAAEGAAPVFHAVFVENDYDVYGLQKGQRAEITVNEDVTVTGVVADIRKEESDSTVISRLISLFSGEGFSTASNYAVVISLDDTAYLEENTVVKITVTTGIAENVLTVPADAIQKADAQHYVWVYKSFGKKLKRQDVSVGLEADGVIEIKKGLSEGDFVVTDVLGENTELYNNVKVKLAADEAKAP